MIASRRLRVAASVVLLLAAGCARREAPARPDVVLVTIDRLRWEERSPWGGGVQAPELGSCREGAARFREAVTPAPGGAPAALSVLVGRPPSGHGVRMRDDGRIDAGAQTLADRLGAEGWLTGAFLQTDDVTVYMQADRGFGAWDGPLPGFPTAHPGASQRRDLEDTAASGLHGLLRARKEQPGFLWVHLAEPAAPDLPATERASRLGELDRIVGALLGSARRRGAERGIRPVIVICNLSSHGVDPALAAREAFMLDAAALRVEILVSGPGLRPGDVAGLAGLDEVAQLAETLAVGAGASRLLELARGAGDQRESVVAETTVPLTCCGAEPLKAALGVAGPSRVGDDPAIASALASDSTWPGGRGAVTAEGALPEFLALDAAWMLARRGRTDEALKAFRAISASPAGSSPGARTGLGLSLASSGLAKESADEFDRLRATAAPGTPAWMQARIGLALAARAAGDAPRARAALDEILAASPGDLRALTMLAEVAEAAGDRPGAVDAIRALLERDPDNPFALAELGRLDLEIGRPRDAAEALTRALGRRPTHPGLLLAAAEAQEAAGDWWSALDRINDRVALYGATPETDFLTGRCWRDTGRFALAEEFFAKTLAARPSDARARLALAEVLLLQGKEEAGRAEWTRARELAPGDPAPCAVLRGWAASAGRNVPAELAAAGCPG